MNEPELVEQLEEERRDDFVADGEIVAFEGNLTSFSRLQARIGIHDTKKARGIGVRVFLYLFDLLHVKGRDTTGLPQRERKVLLEHALRFRGGIRYTPHRNERGEAFLEEACSNGWKGLIAKDALAPYHHGRSRRWLKLKCLKGQEPVIGGYTEPRGARDEFGALLVGHYEDGGLRYAGKVGTGYDENTLKDLGRKLRRLERDGSAFVESVDEERAHFVQPTLVGEFRFTDWTRAGRLRHGRFLGLRTDKEAEKVRREGPEA